MHVPNVMIFQLESGERRLFIVGFYHFPYGALTIESFIVAISQGPCRSDLKVYIDFNADLAFLEGNRHVEEILASISTTVLEDMSTHFLPFCKDWSWDGRIWCMHLQAREGSPQTDYLLGMDCPMFQNVSIWDPLHNSEHYTVL